MYGKRNGLMLDVRKRRVLQITHHMRRHTIDATDLRYLKLARFQKLRLRIWHGDGRIGHVLFQHSHASGIVRTAVSGVPAVPQLLRILHRIGMGQDTAGARTVGEKLASVLFGRQPQPDGVLFEGNRTVSHDPIKAQPRNVQHVFRAQLHRLSAVRRVGIGQRARAVPVYLHAIRQQRIQTEDLAPAAANDLAVGVAPQQQMRKHRFSPDERCHLAVGFVVQNGIQGMIQRLDATFAPILIHMQRQAGDGFGNHPHAGVDRAHLNGGARRDRFARRAGTKIERGRRTDGIGRAGLISGAEQTSKWIFHGFLL